MTLVNQVSLLMSELSEEKQNAILTVLQSMVDPKERLTEEDIVDIKEARAEFARGEFYTWEDVDWKQRNLQ